MTKEILLIVEDNLILRDGLRDILEYEGFEVLTAANGLDALEQLRTAAPDLIISDIAMPEMDGFAFLEAVRSRQEWVSIPFIFMTARGEREDVLTGKNLGADDYLVKPLTRDELVTVVRARLERSRQLSLVQLQQAYEASLSLLANAIEGRDVYTRGHVERVRDYSLALAAQLGWQGRMLEPLRFGATLHDVGKIHISKAILNKPGRPDADEWEEIKKHPIHGADLIQGIPYLAPAVPVIRNHHERWDGRGYPDGLSGEDIPLAARLIAVADAFDAMTFAGRPYAQARTLEDAYAEIRGCSGAQFDPTVVAAFQAAWEAGKILPIWKGWFGARQENNSTANQRE